MQRITLGLLLIFTSCVCFAGNDIWETLFREKLKEANAGNSNAQYDVGAMYQNGRGVAMNRGQAIEWYQKAAAQNNQNAISRLNLIQSNEERFSKTRAHAEKGEVDSQYDLGNMYAEGIGVDADMAKALTWYEKAANQGYEKAQYKLGLIYYEESSAMEDHAKAFRLFQSAAEKGYPAAQFHLGKMYATGQGVKRNYETALDWLHKAADGGFSEARREMIEIAGFLKESPTEQQPESVKTAMIEVKPAATDRQEGTAKPATVAPQNVTAKPATAPRKEPKSRSVTSTRKEKAPEYTFENLMLASWNRGDEPVAYLPSAISNCRVENDKVVCFSDDQSRDTATGTIKYKTKAIISRLAQDGSFEVVYRNLVINADQDPTRKISGSEEVLGSTTAGIASMKYEVKAGWGKEHKLQCAFKDSSTLSCVKNDTYAFLLKSPQTLAAGK
jgi:TPR repeat protein